MNTGTLVISLDFEIHWGVSDHHTIDSYRENLANVPAIVKRSLKLFEQYGVHTTWATVGMLFCETKEEIFSLVEEVNRPSYTEKKFSNYLVAEGAGKNEKEDPFHFASSLITRIKETPGQEVASHTYSHYYCLEPGQTPGQFFYDLRAAKEVAARHNIEISSIVFPANQFHPDYLDTCRKQAIKCYRGNYPSKIYQFQAKSREGYVKRLARLIDTYLPLMGARTVTPVMENGIMNIPASCFLRPYSKRLSFLESLRIRRMKKEMTTAAKRKQVYHLWWHPHNFGANMEKNFAVLETMLRHYDLLKKKYGMQSLTMKEIYEQYSNK